MPRTAKVPLHRLTVSLPEDLWADVHQIVLGGRRWISEVDFIREAVSDQVERWRAQHIHASSAGGDRAAP